MQPVWLYILRGRQFEETSENTLKKSRTNKARSWKQCDILVLKLLGFKTFPIVLMVSVSKFFGIEKSIGIGFENFWYQKKYRIRFRKILVSKKVLVSVSEKIWYRKKYRIRYRKKVLDSVLFWFWVSSHTGMEHLTVLIHSIKPKTTRPNLIGKMLG